MIKVRWGLISTANINRRLIPAIRASIRGELVAVASRDFIKAQAYATTWEIPLAYGNYQDLINSDQVDALYISLPNHLHAEWSIHAMQAGKHVLCEKPLALTIAEVDEMMAVSQQNQRILMEAFMYRHHPQTKLVGDWIRGGHLGEIIQVYTAFNFSLSNRPDIRLLPEFGGGSLWDVGVYPVSLAQFIFGNKPNKVFGSQWTGSSGVDETFAGHMVYDDDHIAQFTCSFRSPLYTSAEIIGTEGRLSLNRPFTHLFDTERQMIFYPKEGAPYEIPVPEEELYLGEVENMNNAILDGSSPYISLTESRDHIRTVLALYQSARSHQSIELV